MPCALAVSSIAARQCTSGHAIRIKVDFYSCTVSLLTEMSYDRVVICVLSI